MKKILFLCTGNSCRSQMAEGFAKKYLGDQFEVYSAGIKKHGMNERVVKVMGEVGIDLSTQYSKTVDELPKNNFDVVVTVCDSAKETCPYYPGSQREHHNFQDPPQITKDMTEEEEILQVYRKVRDEMKRFISSLSIG